MVRKLTATTTNKKDQNPTFPRLILNVRQFLFWRLEGNSKGRLPSLVSFPNEKKAAATFVVDFKLIEIQSGSEVK